MRVAKIAVLVLICVSLFLFAMRSGVKKQDMKADIGPPTTSANNALQEKSSPPELTQGEQSLQSKSAPEVSQSQPTRISPGDSFYDGATADEIAWLNRHGFPSSSDYAKSGILVRREDLRGPMTPLSLLQAQSLGIASEADRRFAVEYLGDAAVQGNLYALESLAGLFQHAKVNNVVLAESYFTASEMLGNWTVGLRMRQYNLDSVQQNTASLMAHQIIVNINRQRAGRGLPPLQYDSRPGLDDFLVALRKKPNSN